MNKISTGSKRKTEQELFPFLINYAFENGISVALWRLPNHDTKHVILSQQHCYLKRDSQLEDLSAGFIFAPFDKEKESVFIPAEFSFSFDKQELKPATTPQEINSALWLDEQLKKNTQTQASSTKAYGTEFNAIDTAKSDFIKFVAQGIHEIENGTFEKVVPSRRKVVDLPADFEITDTFQKLCSAYPNAMISFVSVPGVGSWLGASPELLVQVEDKNIFKTIALAGTKPYDQNINLKSVAWTQKEIEEQALVERYIISCFKKIRLREYDEHGPKTVIAGNLMHLRSDFTVDMKATGFPQLGSTMLQLLHPTSAVCGMPLESSLNFLKTHERYDREFYAGYLGPVNLDYNINIYVNLRCMKLHGNKAIFFSGAGVTIDSDPEAEWSETELKYRTLLNIIFSEK